MTDQIPKSVKTERGRVLMALESELKREYFERLIGERLQLLVEKVEDGGTVSGTSCRYAAIRANLPGAEENQLIDVVIDAANDVLIGHAVGITN